MTTPPSPNPSRRRWLLLGGAAVVIVAVAGGLFWYFGRDVPEEASLEGALEAVAEDPATTTTQAAAGDDTVATTTTTAADTGAETTTTGAAEPPATAGVDGTWTVDTSVGDFSFEEASGSFVGFRINEQLASIGETVAVGRTPEVSGTMEIGGSTISAVDVEADMTALVTNDSRRDDRARGAINTNEFPTASFTLTEPIELGTVPADGEPVMATAVGELTISGVTQPVEFEIEAQREGDLIVVVGRTNVTFVDFGVEVPSAQIVLSVEDNGIVELQLWFSRS